MKNRLLILMISLVWIISSAPTALAWDEGPGGRNEIGDRQFTAGVFDVLNPSTFTFLAIGCTESLFEIKIASEDRFDENYKARIRYDSKKAVSWSISRGPTVENGAIESVEFANPKTIYKNLLTSSTFTVQLRSDGGGVSNLRFNVKNTVKLSKKIRAAGCKV